MTAGSHIRREGDGNGLEKSSGKIYWYGAGTEILDESDGSGNFTNEYVFFGGKRIAIRNVSSGIIDYYEEDMLGSSRTMVQAGQTSVCFDADFLPFGYEKDVTTTCSQNYKFEGKERDTETNNDDFGARYYSSQYGRWLSADWSSVPAPVPYANLTNPQTLNLYAMVSDNPESFADLTGHCGVITPGAPAATRPCNNTNPNGPDDEGEGRLDENSGIPDWYLSEVSATRTQEAAQGAASQNSSAKGFWSRLGHGLSNLFHGHSWNYVKTDVAVSTLAFDPRPNARDGVSFAADTLGVAGTISHSVKLGAAGAAVSLLNDPSPQNLALTALGFVPGPDVPLAFFSAAWDGSKFGASIINSVFVPDASQSDKMVDDYGHAVPNPNSVDMCEALGGNGCQ
jgi:RHS repeat-associated protein